MYDVRRVFKKTEKNNKCVYLIDPYYNLNIFNIKKV